nr:helix-turn-helix transcriptional regulator [uncultured Tyzzerella sp.]
MKDNYIGKKIREYRKKANLTIEEFAEILNLSTTHIGNIERGVKIPTLHTFIKIINTLNISSDIILADYLNSKNEIKLKEIYYELESLTESEKDRVISLFYDIIENSKKYSNK